MFFVHVLLFFKQKTAYEMRISDWSSDVCSSDLTVIDDFAHNPDKVAATLAAVAELPGRALRFFQPHGYGPLRQMGKELAASFAQGMRTGDRLFVSDPVYFGGTVDRSEEHTSELQSLMRISYAVFCLKKKKKINKNNDMYK